MNNIISYRKKYLRIYVWQALSILLGFASLFVVVPYLSSDKTLYGIYSVCTSLTIFFSYADLGFISAGIKYAAEYFIQGDRRNEIRVIGFTAFVMISAFAVVAFAILVLSIYPKLLIPELIDGSQGYHVASKLLLILAISCPIIIGQRILGIVYTIRVEDYKFQRLVICGNVIRILSVFYFFGDGKYCVVEYFLFYQFVNFIIVLVGLYFTRQYGYKLYEILRAIRWNREIFDKVKKISGTSLVMTICMILYYELDQIVISHWIGIEAVAIYGAAMSIMTFVRTFASLVFSPYASRYNHFVGQKDFNGLAGFVNKMILMFGVILVVPLATISLFAKPFVAAWIGSDYLQSALLISLMTFGFSTNFIKDPITSYFVATERNRILLKSNCLLPIIYWVGVFVSIGKIGIYSFALFKFIAPTIVAIYYWWIAKNDFLSKGLTFVPLKDALLPIFWALLTISFLAITIQPIMYYSHDKVSLLINILIMVACLSVAMLVGIMASKKLKEEAYNILNNIKINIHKYGI